MSRDFEIYTSAEYDAEWENIWQHFDRVQKRIMSDQTSRREFFEQPEDERREFYEWLLTQAGEFSCYM